jgi:hypothetical protein
VAAPDRGHRAPAHGVAAHRRNPGPVAQRAARQRAGWRASAASWA